MCSQSGHQISSEIQALCSESGVERGEVTRDHLSGTRSPSPRAQAPTCLSCSILNKTRQWGAGFPASRLRNWGPGRRPFSPGLGQDLTWLPGPAWPGSPHAAGLGHQPLGRAVWAQGPVAGSRQAWAVQAYPRSPRRGPGSGGGPGPPAGHHSLKLDPVSEGEDLCPEGWGPDRQEDPAGAQADPGAPRGQLEDQGDGAMARRVWQGLGGSAGFPTSPPSLPSHQP